MHRFPVPASDDQVDLRVLLGVLVRGRWLVVAAAALALAVGGLYLWITPRVYQADALAQVETQEQSLDAALGQMAALFGQKTPVTAEIEIVQSRLVLGAVVDDLGLAVSAKPDYFPVIGRPIATRYRAEEHEGRLRSAVLGFSRFAWGGERIVVARLDVPDALLNEPLTLEANADGAYSVHDDNGVHLLSGHVGAVASGEGAAQGLSLLVQDLFARPGTRFELERKRRILAIQDIMDALKVVEVGQDSGMLRITYQHTNPARAEMVLNGIVNAYLRQNVERRSAEAAQTLAFLDAELPKLKAKMDAAQSALSAYRLQRGSADLSKETELILEQSADLDSRRLDVEQKRADMLRRFTPDHPAILAIQAQLQQIEDQQKAIEVQVKALPDTQQELLRLSEDSQINTDLYTSLLDSAQQLQLAKAGTVGDVRIVDHAVKPTIPDHPKPALILVASAFIGLILGVMATFVKNALQMGVEDISLVERQLGLTNLASIPYSVVQKKLAREMSADPSKPHLLAMVETNNPAIEALRSLRTSLHFATLGAKNGIISITGPTPDLGKSFITVNFGAVMAFAGKQVVVVDADLRRGHLHEYLGLSRTPGLSDYIVGSAGKDEVVSKTAVPGLCMVTTGNLPPNPAELLLHERFAEFLEYLSRTFDYVIIDTPPTLLVADAAIVGRMAGSTLLVLKAGEHSLRVIDDAVSRLRQAGVELRGALFNQIGLKGSPYGYGYGYDYSYGYTGADGKGKHS